VPETLRRKALRLFQLKRRLESANDAGFVTCVTCGAVDHYTKMDGGHWIPKGRSNRYAFDDRNVHVQCKSCNLFGMKHGVAAFKYMQFMTDKYGQELVDQMLADHNKPLKRGAADYREIIADCSAKINKLKRNML
jgi:hypothetical protein